MKSLNDFQNFYRLSTLRARVRELDGTRTPGAVVAPGFFFVRVGRQMSFFTILEPSAACLAALASGQNVTASNLFRTLRGAGDVFW